MKKETLLIMDVDLNPSASSVPSNRTTGFPASTLVLSTGRRAAVACTASFPLPLLSDHVGTGSPSARPGIASLLSQISENGTGSTHTPPRHAPLAQSALVAHVFPGPHAGQAAPP